MPGHEWSGVIEAVGPDVTGLEPGQRVIAEGIIPDRVCAAGRTNLCEVYDELGFTRAGAAADQILVPAQAVHVLGEEVSLLEAALAEPAAVAWRAIGRGSPRPGERIAVVGDGTLALIAAHLLTLYSPAELVVFGQRPAQADLAAELGATSFELVSPTCRPADLSRDLPVRSSRRRAPRVRWSARSAWPAAAAGWCSSAWQATASRPPSPSTT